MSTEARASDGGWTLSGEKDLVPDASAATDVVVVATGPEGLGLWVARCADAKVEMDPTMDRTRRLGRIVFDGTPAEHVEGDAASSLARRADDRLRGPGLGGCRRGSSSVRARGRAREDARAVRKADRRLPVGLASGRGQLRRHRAGSISCVLGRLVRRRG